MIRTARSDPRVRLGHFYGSQLTRDQGYLRTAQILVRMGKEDKALEIYKSGIQYVTKGSRGAKVRLEVDGRVTRLTDRCCTTCPTSSLYDWRHLKR